LNGDFITHLTRFDPFSTDLNDLFQGLLVRPVRLDTNGGRQLSMKIDVTQDDKSYQVSAEMPGVKKEDIHVEVDGNLVSISAEVKKEKEEKKDERVIQSERYYGKLARSFTLEHEIDESGVDAQYGDGVLKLKLPKSTKSSARKIAVH
jgi:HSP20 family protein